MKLPTFTLRTRLLVVYLAVVGSGFYFLVARTVDDLRPRYLESMEEMMVDTAHLLASTLQAQWRDLEPEEKAPASLLQDAFTRRFHATIYGMVKERVSLRVYVTDRHGVVVYDSEGPAELGKDYSEWRDVGRTLRGEYGARASRKIPNDDASLYLYVGAPLLAPNGDIIGVVTVGKPTESINELVVSARKRLLITAGAAAFLIVIVGFAFSVWIATPIARLTAYAEAVRDGRPAQLPRLAGREVSTLRQAFEEMRAALEGKAYVERYVQSLTHELKSPLSTIRGAAEILQENPPVDVRTRFLGHIRQESARIQSIVDQMLQLATLEARKARADFRLCELSELMEEWGRAFHSAAAARDITLTVDRGPDVQIRADRGLLSQAVGNLLQNALEFTPAGGVVALKATCEDRVVEICIQDSGTGIPDYAVPRLFERFFSLARPGDGRKGTGLGLSIVREIITLHEGTVAVTNTASLGALAVVRLIAVEGRPK